MAEFVSVKVRIRFKICTFTKSYEQFIRSKSKVRSIPIARLTHEKLEQIKI